MPSLQVSAASIFAESALDPDHEIETLSRVRSTPALLRRAYLELQCRRPQAAIDAAAEVLYGSVKPSANEEAFARYLRAEAYTQQGNPERGDYDRDRAAELALDLDLQKRLQQRSPSPAAGAGAAAPAAIAMQTRAGWKATAADRRNLDPMGRPSRLTIHHSAMYFRDTRPAACAAQIQTIQREHMGNRGYGDIGYHFLIDPSGRIWEGRELRWQGAHASGDNNIGNIGICLLGNFLRGRGGQGPSQAQVASMRQLVSHLMQRYEFGADAIHCHSDFKPTECPGPLLEPIVTQLARDLRRQGTGRVASGGVAGH